MARLLERLEPIKKMAWVSAVCLALACVLAPGALAVIHQDRREISFIKDILPILSENCFKCHGAALQLSKLDLRSREAMLKGGQNGPAIVPGDAEASRMYRRISGKETPKMPFEGELAQSEIDLLRDWINQGASWEGMVSATVASSAHSSAGMEEMEIPAEAREYWAFRKPLRPAIPKVRNQEWARHPVDAFLMKVMEERGLTPAPAADRATLLRRAYLDLIGLPPPPEEVVAFTRDTSPDYWERLIDRLLASPHYGERWGRHWLDVARYADSSGFEHDRDRATAWRYRDYVVRSFNKDTPYNVFIAEQLAGDELDNATIDSKIGTGFLRAGPRVAFREKDNPQYRFDYLDDMIATTSQGILGLTVQCARCHNHKFDPIPQKDYYRLQAVFFPYVDVDYYLAPQEETQAFLAKQEEIDSEIKPLREQIAEIEARYKEKVFIAEVVSRFPEDAQIAMKTPESERTPGQKLLVSQLLRAVGVPAASLERALSAEDRAKKAALAAEIKRLESLRPKELPSALGITDGDYRFAPDSYGDEPAPGKGVKREPTLQGSYLHKGPGRYQPPPSYFLFRGEIEARGSVMAPGFVTVATYGNPPTAIVPAHGRTAGRRRALAEWIGSQENPLTARVMVNRVWHHHFGRGIVATLNNFGKSGERPSHPELLDWLACEFVARGWSIKEMHRLIMSSHAYRMASKYDNETNQKVDPENRLLWRFRLRRLDAESLRDSILAASGKLNRDVGGPPIFPRLDASILASMKNGIWKNEEDVSKELRRSLYVYRKRGLPFPLFDVFDLPDQNVSCSQRYVSTVPTQALTLLNNEFVLSQARHLAERVRAEAGAEPDSRPSLLYRIVLSRDVTAEEKSLTVDFLNRQREFHRARSPQNGSEAAADLGAREKEIELLALTDLAHVMLNLNEFIYVR